MKVKGKKIIIMCLAVMAVSMFSLFLFTGVSAKDVRKDVLYVLVNQKVVVAQYDAEGVTVTDSEGQRVSVANNNGEARFFPAKTGIYKITYADKFVTKVHVYGELPQNTYVLTQDFSAEYGVGKEIRLPHAIITSSAATYNEYSIVIEKDGVALKTVNVKSAESENIYKLPQKGNYTVKYCITDVFGNKDSSAYNFVCTGKAEINHIPVPQFLDYGKEFDFGEAVAVKDGQEQKAEITVTYNGEKVGLSGSVIVPVKYGEYKGKFSAVVNGETVSEEFSFQVVITPAGLFDKNDTVLSITPNEPYPFYAQERGHTGVKIVAAASGATVELKNPVSLSSINNGQDIISFQAISGSGYQDIKQIQIALIDVNDESNFIKVNITAHISSVYDAYLKASVKGVAPTGIGSPDYGNEGYIYNDAWGDQCGAMMSHGSFSGSRISKDASVNDKALDFNFRYYAENNQLWATARDMSRYGDPDNKTVVSHLILDLDDESQVGADKAFKGFSSDKVKVRITFTLLQGQSGIILRSLGGYNLEGEIFGDTEAPEIKFVNERDALNFGGDDVPYAVAGKPYKLPAVISEDFVDGVKNVLPQVYRTDGTETLQQTENGCFTPAQPGNYKIVYTAEDSNENKTEKIINLVAYGETQPPVFSEEPSTVPLLLNSVFRIPDVKISNVSGIPSTVKTLEYCGEKIEIDQEVPNLYLSRIGDIVFTQKWTDYLGEEFTKVYTIKVNVEGEYVCVNEVPKVMEAGQKITLPDFIAVNGNYNPGAAGYEMSKKIVVEDSSGEHVLGESREYTAPDSAQDITVKYYANGAGTPQEIRTVKVIKINDGGDEILKYFKTAGYSLQANKDNVTFTTSEENNSVEMPYPIVAENMALRFIFPAGNAKYLDVTLTDTKTPDLKLFLRFSKPENGISELKINGTGKAYAVECKNDAFDLVIDSKSGNLYNSHGDVLAEIKAYSNDTQFLGFTDGIAYVSFGMSQVSGSAQFRLEAISNQLFNNSVAAVYRNNGGNGPAIRYEHNMQTERVKINSKIIVSAAKGYDVLSSFPTAVTVTVTLSTGTSTEVIYDNVAANENRELLLDKYGYYTVTYKANNKFMPAFTQYVTINVIDEVAPSLTVEGTIASEYSVNDTITLPAMNVEDNRPDYGKNVTTKYIFVVRQMRRESFSEGDTYTFTEAGNYQIRYVAYDASFNRTIKTFDIVVK